MTTMAELKKIIGLRDGVKQARNATVISPGKIDRSPCGTASSARLAAHHRGGGLAAQLARRASASGSGPSTGRSSSPADGSRIRCPCRNVK